MKRTWLFIAALLSISVFFAVDADARRGMEWKGSGGWGPGTSYNRMYNPGTVETIEGEVVSVENIMPMKMKGMQTGVHLMVSTGKETISVHLGPARYMENQDLKIEQKDKVGIRGSRITYEGKPAIIAAEIRKGEDTLRLRDEAVFPVWSGWRKR